MTHHNITCDEFQDTLPDYLEGTLSDGSAAGAELHIAACTTCRRLAGDLREIASQAASLPEIAPSRDLWPAIAARTQVRALSIVATPAGRSRWSHWRVGAIAAGLVGITAISTYQFATRGGGGATEAVPSGVSLGPLSSPADSGLSSPDVVVPSPVLVATPVSADVRAPRAEAGLTYNLEIRRLRDVLHERSRELDPATVAILEASIATIDTAIAQARDALARDPASGFLTQQLNNSLERKLGLLRRGALLSPRT